MGPHQAGAQARRLGAQALRTAAILASLVAAACSSGAVDSPQPEQRAPERVTVGDWVIELEPARHLFAPNFGTWRWVDDRLMPVEPDYPKDCYFDGAVVGVAGSLAALRACAPDRSDLVGALIIDGVGWFVSPEGVRRMRGPRGTCGTEARTAEPLAPVVQRPANDGTVTRTFALEAYQPRFIEMLAFRDAAWDSARNSGQPAQDPVLMVQMAAALYDGAPFAERVLPLLVGVVDTGGRDPWGRPGTIGGELPSSPYLNGFNQWLEASTALPPYDQATLFTGWDLDGATVGLANMFSACDPTFAGALVHGVGYADEVASTTAHELGHTLGMSHDGDGNACAREGWIMSAWVPTDPPFATEFSNCSIRYGDQFLGGDDAWCIVPQAQDAYGGSHCGDGKVDAGERCDCGPRGCAGVDPCCDGATCQLRAGASCAMSDGCCDDATCAPLQEAVVCRPAASACDVAERCGGTARCPTDQWVATGVECDDDSGWSGACFEGECVTRGSICEALSDDYVFDNPPYHPMCGDAGCGAMECMAGGACVYTQDDAPDGTVCGDARQCYRGACVASATLPGADGCGEPDLDTDNDGTRDCDDACPTNASATEEPCPMEPDVVDPPLNNGTTGGTTGGPGPGPQPDDPSGDFDVIIVDSDDPSGCSTASNSRSGPWSLLIAVVPFARRRRRGRSASQGV